MIFINLAEKSGLTTDSYCIFLRLLAPFAPHLSEELWHESGQIDSIHTQSWPVADTALLVEDMSVIGVQINGKMRGRIIIAKNTEESDIIEDIKNNPQFKGKLDKGITKSFYIPNKMINILTLSG
jgi:leucyl-tRNA synthetase